MHDTGTGTTESIESATPVAAAREGPVNVSTGGRAVYALSGLYRQGRMAKVATAVHDQFDCNKTQQTTQPKGVPMPRTQFAMPRACPAVPHSPCSAMAVDATPDANQVVAAIEGAFGVTSGERRNHIKGTRCAGEFVGICWKRQSSAVATLFRPAGSGHRPLFAIRWQPEGA